MTDCLTADELAYSHVLMEKVRTLKAQLDQLVPAFNRAEAARQEHRDYLRERYALGPDDRIEDDGRIVRQTENNSHSDIQETASVY